jgi:methionyl-tRNA formyltransferase
MKTIFFGTPAIAVPYLELLAQLSDLKAVVTTPDEPAGRGYELQPTPVKQAALKRSLPVLQPATLKDPAFLEQLAAFQAELVIVVAYGKILPAAVLQIPRHGYLNVHFSLLPAYRGAAPIQRALMNGESRTGVTLFWLDAGMDTGPIFWQQAIDVPEDADADLLREKLVQLGMDGLKTVVEQVGRGQIVRTPQTGPSSLAPSLKKEEGKIDWGRPAREIANLVRGTYPWPGAFTFVPVAGKTQRLKILKATSIPHPSPLPSRERGSSTEGRAEGEGWSDATPGTVVHLDNGKGFVVKCGTDFLQILHVQPEGKRPMSAWDYWQGARLKIGEKLRSL